jgi:hypothetical protein
MTHQHARIFSSLGAAAVLVGTAALGGCGADAGSTTSKTGPSSGMVAKNDPPPPPRPQSKEECDACGGLWAVHGIEPVESCICATKDSGYRCTDGRECEGQCIVDTEAGFQIMDASSPPRGFFTGKCSPYDTTFGCLFVIPPGIDDQLPLPPDEAAQHICID